MVVSGQQEENPVRHDGMRGVRYGEVLAVFMRDDVLEAEVYGTQMLNDCPQALWDGLDPTAIAAEMGAMFVKLNGPRYWAIDGLGRKVATVEPIMRDFNGITMRRIATVEIGPDAGGIGPYTERHVNRGATFFFEAGKPVYELVNPSGLAYMLQAWCVGVDPSLTERDLPKLGSRLRLPEGWTFRTRTLFEEVVVDTTDHLATVIQDELENTYTLP